MHGQSYLCFIVFLTIIQTNKEIVVANYGNSFLAIILSLFMSIVISKLKQKEYDVATRLLQAHVFWKAEAYHQDYYEKQHHKPYCHQPVLRFESSSEKG